MIRIAYDVRNGTWYTEADRVSAAVCSGIINIINGDIENGIKASKSVLSNQTDNQQTQITHCRTMSVPIKEDYF